MKLRFEPDLDFQKRAVHGVCDLFRGMEAAKIECGKAHFKALETREEPARYRVATSVDELLAGVRDAKRSVTRVQLS